MKIGCSGDSRNKLNVIQNLSEVDRNISDENENSKMTMKPFGKDFGIINCSIYSFLSTAQPIYNWNYTFNKLTWKSFLKGMEVWIQTLWNYTG